MLRDACRALCSSPPTEVRINPVFPLSSPPSRLPSPWVGHPHPAALTLPGGFPLSSSSAGNARAKPRAPSLLSTSNSGAPKGKHLSGAGPRVALPLPPENSGSLGVRRAGRTVPPRAVSDPAPPPPPARPAEPARAVSAGGSRPPPSCNGRRRSDAFPSSSPVSKIWVPSLPLLTPRSSAHQDWTSPCR